MSFGNQWSVGFCDRYGRDLIRLELKKLYEGNRPYIVQHYHEHAVEEPEGDVQALLNAPNIGRRAKRIVYAFVSLGEALADLCGEVINESITSHDTVRMRRVDLDYQGWWTAEYVEPICRHAPLSMTRDGFIGRCKDMANLVLEGLALRPLKRSLVSLRISDATSWGSLKCLSHLVGLCKHAHEAGLSLLDDSPTVVSEFAGPSEPKPCARLFALNALRQLDAHRAGSNRDDELKRGLEAFGVDPATTAAGYGRALDAVYDGIAAELEELAAELNG